MVSGGGLRARAGGNVCLERVQQPTVLANDSLRDRHGMEDGGGSRFGGRRSGRHVVKDLTR